MLTKLYRHTTAVLFSAIVLILAGCGSSETSTATSGTGSISAKLVWDGGKSSAKSVALAPAGVTTVRIAISGSAMTTVQQDFTAVPGQSGSGTISNVPVGTGLTVTASGLNAGGTIIYQGAVTDKTVLAGVNTDVGTITMLPIANEAATVIAGSGTAGYADGTGTAAQFKYANSITTDGTDLYVANGRTVRKVTPTGVVTTIAGSEGVSGSADGTGILASFKSCSGIVADEEGNLYVTDALSNTIRKIVISTGVVTTIAGLADQTGSTDAVGTAARFSQPSAITTDGTDLYVADYANGSIRKIDIASRAVTTVASVQYPKGITTYQGSLYVTDGTNVVIYRIASSTSLPWIADVVAGTPGQAGSTDGSAAKFNSPYGIIAADGFLYVADFGNYAIRKINIATNSVTTIANLGSVKPTGITVIGSDIYMSNDNNKITKLN